jgi:hypothetical protein
MQLLWWMFGLGPGGLRALVFVFLHIQNYQEPIGSLHALGDAVTNACTLLNHVM